jgi:hypothetical protein
MAMSEILTIVAICAIFGYGFFMGWWARGKALRGIEQSLEAWRKLGEAIKRGEKLTVTEVDSKTGKGKFDA